MYKHQIVMLLLKTGSLRSFIARNGVLILSSFILSLLYILLLLYYSHGLLLNGGDSVGYYSIGASLFSLIPRSMIAAIGIALGLGNYYAGYYISQFVNAFLTLAAVYFLATKMFEGYMDKRFLIKIGILSELLYLFSPFVLTDLFNRSLITNLFINNAAFIFFLAFVIDFWKFDSKFREYPRTNLVLMGLALGLSLGAFPNSARYLLGGYIILLYFMFLKFISSNAKKPRQELVRYASMFGVFLISSLIFGLYTFVPLLQNVGNTQAFASSAANANSNPAFYSGQFNTLVEVFRLFGGSHDFLLNFAPYHYLYFTNLILVISSLLWPLFALAMPVFLMDKKTQHVLLPVAILLILVIFYGKGANLPLPFIYNATSSIAPFGQELMPTYFANDLVLTKFYPILAAFSILVIGSLISERFFKNYTNRAGANFLIVSVLVVLLLICVTPAFNGQLEQSYFNQSANGYAIPGSYQAAKSYMLSDPGSVLVLPGTKQYIQTSWNYQGDNRFYYQFFFPLNIYSESSFYLYPDYRSISLATYYNMTTPVKPGTNVTQLNVQYGKPVVSTIRNNTLTNSSSVRVIMPLKNTLNISGFDYLRIQLVTQNRTALADSILDNGFSISLLSKYQRGLYNITPTSCQKCFISGLNTSTVNITLVTHIPNSVPSPPEAYNTSGVDKIVLQFGNLSPNSTIILSTPTLYGISGFSLSSNWANTTKQYNIKYILFDKSLVNGESQTYGFVNRELHYLTSTSNLKQVYNSNYLSIYKVNVS